MGAAARFAGAGVRYSGAGVVDGGFLDPEPESVARGAELGIVGRLIAILAVRTPSRPVPKTSTSRVASNAKPIIQFPIEVAERSMT
jgi:hypothetical protein